MITPDRVSAVLVTRGDCDMDPILAPLLAAGITDIIIWDNAKAEKDLGIYGRYAAIGEAKNDVVVTQDDDVLVHCWPELLERYEPGKLIVNYPEPWDVPWVARGAIFDALLPTAAFTRYWMDWPCDRLFTHRICDAVFALLSDARVYDLGTEDLPHGFAAGRVSTSDGWYDRDRPEAQRRCQELLAA